jgi:hypothetical protein
LIGKNNEIWVGKSRFYLGEDNIIYAYPVGEIDEKTAYTIKKSIINLAKLADGKANSLVDLNRLGRPSMKARRIGKKALEHEKVGKLAFYGLHPVAKMLASFVMGVTKNKEMRLFETREEALAWLKE